LFEVANSVEGRIHHFTYLEIPSAVVTGGYLSVNALAAKIARGSDCTFTIGEYGVELYRMDTGEIETAFFHPQQYVAAYILMEGGTHKNNLLALMDERCLE